MGGGSYPIPGILSGSSKAPLAILTKKGHLAGHIIHNVLRFHPYYQHHFRSCDHYPTAAGRMVLIEMKDPAKKPFSPESGFFFGILKGLPE